MTSDTITTQRIRDIIVACDIIRAAFERVYEQTITGDITPAEAAAQVNESINWIQSVAR